jgi:hypothetical protein
MQNNFSPEKIPYCGVVSAFFEKGEKNFHFSASKNSRCAFGMTEGRSAPKKYES